MRGRFKSEEELQYFLKNNQNSFVPSPRQPKYKNVKVEVDGEKFDSKLERDRILELRMLEKAGEISNLKIKVRLDIPVLNHRGETIVIRRIIPDATYRMKDGTEVIEDQKGFFTPYQKLKYDLFEAVTGRKITLYKKERTNGRRTRTKK